MVCAGLVCPARGCISVWVNDPVPGWERLMVLNSEPLVRPWPWWCLAVVGETRCWSGPPWSISYDCRTAWTFAP